MKILLRYSCMFLLFAGGILFANEEAPADPDEEEAISPEKQLEAMQDLAKDGDSAAQLKLGIVYIYGNLGQQADPEKARYWLKKSAEPRIDKETDKATINGRALMYLGMSYDGWFKNAKFDEDKAKALDYYQGALQQGIYRANHYIAFLLKSQGQHKASVPYFKRAAQRNNKYCAFELGKIYLEGRGEVKADAKLAIEFLTQSAQIGYAPAQLQLAECYAGSYPIIEKDYTKMVDWLWQASTKSPEAMTKIGYCYMNGIELKKDPYLAVKWFRKAAENGDIRGLIEFAKCLQNGIGIDKDEARASRVYQQAVDIAEGRKDKMLAGAYFHLALSHILGVGGEADDHKGFMLFLKAHESNPTYLPAIMNIATFYKTGRAYAKDGKKLSPDPKKSFEYFLKAAELKNPQAQLEVADAYYYGKGVEKNQEKARQYFKLAADQGHPEAAAALKKLF